MAFVKKLKIIFKTILVLIFISCSNGSSTKTEGSKKREPSSKKGELDKRISLSYNRLTTAQHHPIFDEKFILADVNHNLKDPRRFYNFSGDLSGRYIEVVAMFDQSNQNMVKLGPLVNKLLKYQKKDGRFGDDSLIFSADQIGGEHMALLWGNGRLLVGLMEYYQQTKDEDVLEAAKKLGDFFIATYEACAEPEVRKKLEGFGAKGIICFTQYVEGLAMLFKDTQDQRYANVAAKAYPILPDRGKQHSHGYLSTLRGVVLLYDHTRQRKHLDFVVQKLDDLLNSDDYTYFSSVKEYFGGKGTRDEGCSTSDFLRLNFMIHERTNDIKYLNVAEKALLNALYMNQLESGDFGHHHWGKIGLMPSQITASWWCCTMHGLRALTAVKKEYLVNKDENRYTINLFFDSEYSDGNLHYLMTDRGFQEGRHLYSVEIKELDENHQLSIRIPYWVKDYEIKLRNNQVDNSGTNDLVLIEDAKSGDDITVSFKFKKLLNTETKSIELDELKVKTKGILQYGPYLMGVDQASDPVFTAEPNNNIIMAQSVKHHNTKMNEPMSDYFLSAIYKHQGYPSKLEMVLKPMATLMYKGHPYHQLKIDYSTQLSVGLSDEILAPPIE